MSEIYSVEKRALICHTFIMYKSWKCHRKFCKKYPTSTVPCKRTVCSIMEKFQMTSSVLDKKKTQKYYVWNEEKVDNTGSQIGISLKKSLCKFTVQNELTKFLTQGKKRFKLCQYKIRGVQQLFLLDWKARSWFCGFKANGYLIWNLFFLHIKYCLH